MNRFPHLFCTFAALTLASSVLAVDDIPPVDPKPLLQALKTLREQSTVQEKSLKQRMIQESAAAATNPTRAVELWEDSVRATQFQGVTKESTQFREWKEKEGSNLTEKEVLSALHLYFNWLSLTLQRSSGAETKTLLPAVVNHAREVMVDQMMMDGYEDTLKREKETVQNQAGKMGAARAKERQRDGEAVKRLHDNILKKGLAGSPFVQWMKIGEIVGEVAPARKGNGKRGPGDAEEGSHAWESTPGEYDGIYTQIILPELRAIKDVRVLEYWDAKVRRETEAASKSKLDFAVDRFTQVRRPQLLWSRAQDMLSIGQKNRAIGDMFNVIKANPTHPDADGWMTALEQLLAPAPPVTGVSNPTPPATAGAATPAAP